MRIIYTAGVWDLFHIGHLRFLKASAELGHTLIVGVVTDEGCEAYKGKRPVIPQEERLAIVESLYFVDAAFLQPGTDPSPVIDSLVGIDYTPQIMSHGDDWTELREGMGTLQRFGIELRLLPYGSGTGTTGIIERIQQNTRAALLP